MEEKLANDLQKHWAQEVDRYLKVHYELLGGKFEDHTTDPNLEKTVKELYDFLIEQGLSNIKEYYDSISYKAPLPTRIEMLKYAIENVTIQPMINDLKEKYNAVTT